MTTALSLFAGCGGDSLGLEMAGCSVEAMVEKLVPAIASHHANFPQCPQLLGPGGITDITKIPDEVFEPYEGKIDIVFAGFPCQGFSHAGKKQVDDPRNQLYLHFVRAVRLIRPLFVIGENVPGLLTRLGPDGFPFFNIISEAFQEIGYTLTAQVLNASDYGVPQARKRLLMVGWENCYHPQLTPEVFWTRVATHRQPSIPMSSFLQRTLEGGLLLENNQVPVGFDTVALTVDTKIQVTGTPHPYLRLKVNGLLSVGKRISPNHAEVINPEQPSKTIICTYDHQPRLLVGVRTGTKRYVRCLLPDELKQIQGFPSSYILTGSIKDQIIQVGNAVPPLLVSAVARSLLDK